MKVYDLTHTIQNDMPVYPGTEQPKLTTACTIEAVGYRETLLHMFSHTGTHMDAPAHMLLDGAALDRYPGEKFAGTAVVVDCRERESISLPLLQSYDLDGVDFPNHIALLGADFVNTENLTGLDALIGRRFTFVTLPLKFENSDGCSCRAIAMEE